MINVTTGRLSRARSSFYFDSAMRHACSVCAVVAPNVDSPGLARHAGDAIQSTKDFFGTVLQSSQETARAARFWSIVLAIWGRYKVTQVRTSAAEKMGDAAEYERLWAKRHAHEAEAMWNLCVGMRGFYVKAGQLIALQTFVPNVIRARLAKLQGDMPAMPKLKARAAISDELAKVNASITSVFSDLTLDSTLGSASIAQVHWGRLKSNNAEVAVKIQIPGGERRMENDLNNFRFLGALLQRTEFNFDLVNPIKELARQISYEFDFQREAAAMTEISKNLRGIPGVDVPLPVLNVSTRRLLVMDFMYGVPLSKMESITKHLGMRERRVLGRRVLRKMARSYGEMVLSNGFFQADCHPGNVLVTNRRADIALLDFGQTKRLSNQSRLRFANLVGAIARRDRDAVASGMRILGIDVVPTADFAEGKISAAPDRGQRHRHLTGAEKLAYTMFDTAEMPGVSHNPFSEDSALKTATVSSFPPDLFFLLRTVQIFKGICSATGNSDFSLAKEWAPIARRALANSYAM